MLRPIQSKDNQAIAQLIRSSLEAFGLDKPGTAYYDPQLNQLTEYYAGLAKSAYFVIEHEGQILACGGFGPVSGKIAELQKLYVAAEHRGKGLSSLLLTKIFDLAKREGYEKLYLETATELASAVAVYEHFGFKTLDEPLPNEAGHSQMDIWMIKDL